MEEMSYSIVCQALSVIAVPGLTNTSRQVVPFVLTSTVTRVLLSTFVFSQRLNRSRVVFRVERSTGVLVR